MDNLIYMTLDEVYSHASVIHSNPQFVVGNFVNFICRDTDECIFTARVIYTDGI